MRAGLKRATTTLVFTAAGAVALVGCDSGERQADKRVQENLRSATEITLSGESGAADASRKLLETAVTETEASPAMKAIANASLGHASLESALSTIDKIDRAELDLARLGWEITQLAQQVRTGGSAVLGYRKFDPKAARDAIAAKIAEAQGGPGKAAWFTHDSATIPTLSAVTQDISRIEGELAQLQEQVKTLTDQRNKLLEDAQNAAAQADQLKGEQAVEVFKKSSQLRRDAGQVAIELDKLQVNIDRQKGALAIAQGQRTIINEVISGLQEQSASLEAAWKQIDAQVARQEQLAAQVLGSASAAAPTAENPSTIGASIAEKAAALGKLAEEIAAMRETAREGLSNADKYFSDAYRAADSLRGQLKTDIDEPKNQGRPEIAAWKDMLAAVDPMQYKLQQAAVQRSLGALYAAEAASLSRRVAVQQTVAAAVEPLGKPVPPPIASGDLAKSRTAALQLADGAYKASQELLTDIIDGLASEEVQARARLSRALTHYGWSYVQRLAGNDTAAAESIQASINDRNSAAERNLPIPALPVELGVAPKPKPAETETPTEGTQATAPAEDPAAREALTRFAEALVNGDADAARAAAQVEPGQEAVLEQTINAIAEMKKFMEAAKEKYGDQAAAIPNMATANAMSLRMAKISIEGDEGFVQGPGETTPRKRLVKVDGQWKVFIGAPTTPEATAERAMMEKAAAALPQLTNDVREGKYPTLLDALKAFAEAVGAPAMPAPPAPPGGDAATPPPAQ